MDLTTADTIYINQSIQTCDVYFLEPSDSLTQTGIYRFDTINQFGCDSTVDLDLTIHPSNATNIVHITTCLRWLPQLEWTKPTIPVESIRTEQQK
ncbi:MAG: hypothetical protein IPN15_20365 [Saprospiraceae bacterium]|nr:hypothetical protein [Candidatus Vicinibacter affinis]